MIEKYREYEDNEGGEMKLNANFSRFVCTVELEKISRSQDSIKSHHLGEKFQRIILRFIALFGYFSFFFRVKSKIN